MKNLTRKEELILLSILNLQKNAYLVSIVDYLSELTSKKVSMTSVHLPLVRLEKENIIESKFGESTAVRGGRRKKIYTITKKGFELLNEYKKITDVLWEKYAGLFSPKE